VVAELVQLVVLCLDWLRFTKVSDATNQYWLLSTAGRLLLWYTKIWQEGWRIVDSVWTHYTCIISTMLFSPDVIIEQRIIIAQPGNRSIPAFMSSCCNVHDGAQLLIYDLLACLDVPAHVSWASMTAHSSGATFLAIFIILLTWCLWSNKPTLPFNKNAESGHATQNAHWWRRKGPNRPHVT
jgi:hypothetical protein